MSGFSRRKAVTYLVAVFLAGIVSGGVGGYAVGKRSLFRQPPPAQTMAQGMVAHMKAELGLTEEQVRKLEPIAEEAAREMEAIHHQVGEQVLEAMRRTNRRIEQFLTPAQQEALRQRERKHEERLRRHHAPGAARPPGGS